MCKKHHSYMNQEQKEIIKVIFMSIRIDITILINATILCNIGTIYISLICYNYVLMIPSNDLKKGYIRFIKLGIFLPQHFRVGGGRYPHPWLICLSKLQESPEIYQLFSTKIWHNISIKNIRELQIISFEAPWCFFKKLLA